MSPDGNGGAGATPIEIVPSPAAPVGSADPSRRWALAAPGGLARFHGVTRPEGEGASPALAAAGEETWDEHLVRVTLAVVLSDGAGPYLLDADGRLTLVLGPHDQIADAYVAMGEAAPFHSIGLVEAVGDGPVWRWVAAARIPNPERVAALDGLASCRDRDEARRWAVGASR